MQKLVDGRSLASARKHTLRLLRTKRFPLETKRVIETMNSAGFHLITAFMICFNDHKMPGLWKVPEWEFFLDDLAKHLTPRGRVWLELNQEYDGTFYTLELKEFFQKCGARIDEHKVIFTSGLRAPASTLSVARG